MNWIFKEIANSRLATSIKSLLIDDESVSSSFPIPIDPERYTTPFGQDGWAFQQYGGDYHYFKYEGFKSAVDAYKRCPPVNAIINRKAQAFINGKVWVLNSKEKESDSTQARKLRLLFNKPNPLQTRREFEAQMYIYIQTFGFCIILPLIPTGYTERIDVGSMWNIPASWIDTQATQENFTRNGGVTLTEIVVTFNGTRTILKLSELIIVKDVTPSFNTITFPSSRLAAQHLPINNIIGAYESRNVLINYRGALGILSQDPGKGQFVPLPLTDTEKTDLQRDFRKYGLRARQFQVILTTAALKWQQMGYPTKDLMLMEEVQESTKDLCNGLNFPPFILGMADTTFNNMNAAEKALYQNSIIPDAENIYEQLTAWFQLDNIRLDKDFSKIPVLQEDRKMLADARWSLNKAMEVEWRNGLITLNEWRTKNDEDPLTDARGNMYFPEYVAIYGDPQKPANNGTQQSGQGSNGGQQEGQG